MLAPCLRVHTDATRRARAALSCLALSLACTGAPATPELAPADATSAETGSVRVQLFFGADADLDLYVTGPALETVYFANPVSVDGGALDDDVRCDDELPRVESIVFPFPAPAGPYRVGVDFPARCDAGVERAPFVVRIDAPGGRQEISGDAHFALFEPRVAEFAVPD